MIAYSFYLNVHVPVHFKNIPIYIQQDARLHSLFYLETALHVSGGTSTLGWRYHPKHVEQFPDKINRITLRLVGYTLG